MKEFYKSYIKVTQDEKITDSVFNTRIILSVVAILACVTVMFSTAFAFFSTSMTEEFTMHAATWTLNISEIRSGSVLSSYTCPDTTGEMHQFTLVPSGTATKGYCIISITNRAGMVQQYCTPAFTGTHHVSVQAVEGTIIEFLPQWGEPVDYGITNITGGTIYHSATPFDNGEGGDEGEGEGEGAEGSTVAEGSEGAEGSAAGTTAAGGSTTTSGGSTAASTGGASTTTSGGSTSSATSSTSTSKSSNGTSKKSGSAVSNLINSAASSTTE